MIKTFRALFVSGAVLSLLAISPAAQAQDKTVKIGALFPMSGPGSYFGTQENRVLNLHWSSSTRRA